MCVGGAFEFVSLEFPLGHGDKRNEAKRSDDDKRNEAKRSDDDNRSDSDDDKRSDSDDCLVRLSC